MLKILSLVVVLLAAACGSGSKQAPETGGTGGGQALLALGEMKVIDVDKNQAALIHADGTIEVDGRKIAKVTADGKLVKIDTGEVGLTLNPDGTVTGHDGKDLGIQIAADGSITKGDKTITIAANGELVGGNPAAPRMKLEGATDDKLKRAAMFVLVAMTMGGEVKSEVKSETP